MGEFSSINGSDASAGSGRDAGGEVITCKAAVVWGAGEPFKMEEIEVDPPQHMEVRLRILFTAICHTDLSSWLGENESQRVFPRILGHEAAGVVESVGDGVEGLSPGDRVVPVFNGECGGCRGCKTAKTNLCAGYAVDPSRSVMRADGRVRFHWVGPGGERRPVYHFLNTSTFAEYTVMDSACVVKIAADAPLDRMCLLSCGISTGVGAAWNTANVEEGSSLAIFGLGAVGLAVAEGARLRGAARIIGVDINSNKFAKGKEMGITDFIDPKECTKPLHEVIRELTKGGVDYSFECSGNLDVLREAFLSTHVGWGQTVILGVHPSPKLLPLHPMELFGRKIVASVFGDFKPKSQLPDLVIKCMKGEAKINLEGFITHKLPFSEINQAFQLLSEGKALRKDKGLLWRLDDYDWERFLKIRNMLEVFEEATKTFSGTLYPTSNLFFPGVIEIKEHIERGTLDEDNLVRLMCLNMKEKFDKYWSECGLLMAIAIVLDPRYKMSFIKFAFQSIYQSSEYDARVQYVRDSLVDLYSYYSVMPAKINSDGTFLGGDVAVGPPKNSLIRSFDDYLESSCATKPLKSELEVYLEDDLVKLPQEMKNKFEILDWWKMISLKLPTLSKMAKDILTVPITTVASESAFSAGGRVLDDYRSALSPASVNALVCTSNWLSAQFKKPKDPMRNILMEEELTIHIPDSTSGSTSGC